MSARSREREIQLAREKDQAAWAAERERAAREAAEIAETERIQAETAQRELEAHIEHRELEENRRVRRMELVARAAEGDTGAVTRLLASKGISARRVLGDEFVPEPTPGAPEPVPTPATTAVKTPRFMPARTREEKIARSLVQLIPALTGVRPPDTDPDTDPDE